MTAKELERLGLAVSRVQADYHRLPLRTCEGGLCQLRDSLALDRKINRYYGIAGPSYTELERSFQSGWLGKTSPYYCRIDVYEYGQREGDEQIQALSWLAAQVKVTQLRRCSDKDAKDCITVKGIVNRLYAEAQHPSTEPEDDEAMNPARLVISKTDNLEFVYNTHVQIGRLLGVLRFGMLCTYNFTPEQYIKRGGFAPVQLTVI